MSDLSKILKLLEKLMEVESLIETKVKQVKDVKKRKAIVKAIKNRDRDALNKLILGR